MPAIITNKFRINNSEQFHESFTEASPNIYYLGLARPQAYGTSTRGDGRTDYEGTDANPVTPSDTVVTEFSAFDDLLAAKKITSSDVSFAVPRRNWATGTTYDIYRHDYGEYTTGSTSTKNTANGGATTLHDANFYVLTSDRNVYKCIDNDDNTASTIEPTGTGNAIITTADGYKWKYMYTMSASQQSNFLSTDFMAVSTNSTVSSAAIDGSIDCIKIKSAGSGGTNGTHSVTIKGDGSSATANVVVAGGIITEVTMTNVGSGYTFGTVSNAEIVSAGATNLTGAELDVIISPKGGHGFNAVQELGGFFVMLNINLEGTE